MGKAPERVDMRERERYVESQVCGLCGNIVSAKVKKVTPIGVGRDGTMRFIHKACELAFREKAKNLTFERKVAHG